MFFSNHKKYKFSHMQTYKAQTKNIYKCNKKMEHAHARSGKYISLFYVFFFIAIGKYTANSGLYGSIVHSSIHICSYTVN